MASGRQVVGEKNRSTAIVPIRIAAEHADEPEDPRLSDVDEWGRSERTRALARAIYEPDLLQVVPHGVGGAREDPGRGRRAARRQPCRRHPFRRAGHHARDREGARAARLRIGRLLLPDRAGRRDPVGARRRRLGPPRQRLPAPEGTAAARAGLPRGHQGDVQVVHRPLPTPPLRARRLRRDRHAGRRARSSPSPSSAPRRRCRSCCGCRPWPARSASPTSPSRPTCSPSGRSGW